MNSNQEPTMSSLQVSKLVGSDHAKVRQSIERLAKRGTIQLPPMEKVENKQSLSPNKWTKVYLINERDSYIVVAQLSPEFTAKLVDEWKALKEASQPQLPQTYLEALQHLVVSETGRVEAIEYGKEQEALVEAAKPKVSFVDEYVEADGLYNLRDTSKILGYKPLVFNNMLIKDKILFKSNGINTPYQYHIDRGYFEVIIGNGQQGSYKQTMVTPKGVYWLHEKYQPEPEELNMFGMLVKSRKKKLKAI